MPNEVIKLEKQNKNEEILPGQNSPGRGRFVDVICSSETPTWLPALPEESPAISPDPNSESIKKKKK